MRVRNKVRPSKAQVARSNRNIGSGGSPAPGCSASQRGAADPKRKTQANQRYRNKKMYGGVIGKIRQGIVADK
jgi:hypothetical protein